MGVVFGFYFCMVNVICIVVCYNNIILIEDWYGINLCCLVDYLCCYYEFLFFFVFILDGEEMIYLDELDLLNMI